MDNALARAGSIGALSANVVAGMDEEDCIHIETRFGEVAVNAEKAIHFPQGVLGMPDMRRFCLTEIPVPKLAAQFKLLQSLDDEQLSFVVLPLAAQNPLIEMKDIIECSKTLSITQNDMVLLLIISTRKMPEGLVISANVRAPLVVDIKERSAVQFVFSNNAYEIRHILNS